MTENELGEFPDERNEISPDESPLDVYVHERRHELLPGSVRSIRTSWHRLEEWLNEEGYSLFEVDFDRAIDFAEWLNRRLGYSSSGYMLDIANVISRLSEDGYIRGSNPFAKAYRVYDFTNPDKKSKVEIPYSELLDAVRDISRPSIFGGVTTMLKAGIRIGSLVNLDDRDVHLNHPVSNVMESPRTAIKDKPNSIYIDSDITEGSVHRGELRKNSVKKKSTRAIPIDDELVNILGWYRSLKVRSSSDANPFFACNGGRNTEGIGSRPSKQYFREGMYEWCDQYDWGEDMHPHWCRHWWTTQMRVNIDPEEVHLGTVKGFVEGLRGDTRDGVIETYTHEWTEGLETNDIEPYAEVVRRNMPKLL